MTVGISEYPELQSLKSTVDGIIYGAVIGITEREEHSGKYIGNGHHLAQELQKFCTDSFLTNLPDVLRGIGKLVTKTLDRTDFKYFLVVSVFNPPIFKIINDRKKNGSYVGNTLDLTRELTQACAQIVLNKSLSILNELAQLFVPESAVCVPNINVARELVNSD